jgi:hypothetical protein
VLPFSRRGCYRRIMLPGRRPGSVLRLGSLGATEHWLVCASTNSLHAGERALDPARGLAAIRRAVLGHTADLAAVQALLGRVDQSAVIARMQSEQWRALESALRRGQLRVIEREPPLARLAHGDLGPEDAHAPAVDTTTPISEGLALARVRVRVVELGDQAVAALALELDASDAAPRQLSTPADGRLTIDGVHLGRHGLRIVDLDAVEWDSDPEHLATEIRVHSDERRVDIALDLRGQPSGSVGVDAEIPNHRSIANLLVIARPRLHFVVPGFSGPCGPAGFLRYDHDSALLVPAPWTGNRHPLAGLVHALVTLLDEPSWILLIIGHTSASGKAANNQTLSEQRADAIRALIERDTSAWVEHARKRGSLRDVMAYLDYLGRARGWPCACDVPVESLGTAANQHTQAAIAAFQAEYNIQFDASLDVDGVCGEQTLRAVFDVLYDEFDLWLDKLGTSPAAVPRGRVIYAGHGPTLAGRPSAGADPEAADRVVDLILVEGTKLGDPFDPAEVYDSRVAWRLCLEFPDEPHEWATGPFTIVSDLTPDEPVETESYRLRSDDGSWDTQHVLPEHGVVESGELVLHFPELPTELRYTLTVTAHDGHESVIFESVSYGQLHARSRANP